MLDSAMPDAHVCPSHSGLHHRIKDLEGRAHAAAQERKSMNKEIVALRLLLAKYAGGLAVLLAVVQVATSYLLRALP